MSTGQKTADSISTGDIRHDPSMIRLLDKMPAGIAASFSDEQLMYLRNAIGARNWGRHAVDLRGTVAVPLSPWRFYYVLLLGRNKRRLSQREKAISTFATALMLTGFIFFCLLLGLLLLYLAKSAAGIDLFPGFSLGIWSWFKETFLH